MFIRIILLIFLFVNHAYADKNKLTASIEVDSDHNSKKNEYLLKFKQKDDKKKYSQEIELNIDRNYSLIEQKFEKTKDLIDYEHELKYFNQNDLFATAFYRHKYDEFATSVEQNFKLITIGAGINKDHAKREFSAQLSVGQRRSSDLHYIYMPKISYTEKLAKLELHTSHSIVKDHESEIIKSKFSLEYPINKMINIEYIFKYERSKDNLTTEISRNNKIALALKF